MESSHAGKNQKKGVRAESVRGKREEFWKKKRMGGRRMAPVTEKKKHFEKNFNGQ